MPPLSFSDPISPADAAARNAFRAMREHHGAAELARQLGIARRTVERIGTARDVPPGVALDCAEYLAGDEALEAMGWRITFMEWAAERMAGGKDHG